MPAQPPDKIPTIATIQHRTRNRPLALDLSGRFLAAKSGSNVRVDHPPGGDDEFTGGSLKEPIAKFICQGQSKL
jgi:hypothetical protein